MNKFTRIILLLVGLLIILVVVIIATNNSDLFLGLFGKKQQTGLTYGEQLLSERRYEEALSFFHDKVQKGENLQLSYFGRGNALIGLRRFEEGIQDYTSSLDIQRLPIVLASRCNTYRIIGKFDSALSDCNEAINLDPQIPDAYLALSLLYLEQGNLPEAKKAVQELIQLDPDNATTYFTLSRILTMEGKFEEAIDSLTTAIQLDPDQPQFYWERGFLYYSNAKIPESEADMRKLIEIANPETDGELIYQAGTLLKTYSGYQESNP